MSIKSILITLLNTFLMTVIVTPLLLVLIIPLAIYRNCVNLLSKIFRRDLKEITRPRDSLFANDKVTIKPDSTALILTFLPGDLDFETFSKHVTEIDSRVRPDGKKSEYPTFAQYFENWCGFAFRKQDENFDIKCHIKEWQKSIKKSDSETSVVTSEDLYHLRRKLLTEPYKPKISPWELILVRNYQETQDKPKGSVIILKIHHGIIDGYSITKIIFKTAITSIKDIASAIPQSVSKPLTFTQSLALFSYTFTQAPSAAASQNALVHPANIFHPSNYKPVGKRHPLTTTIPINIVKSTAKQTQTSFTSVIIEGLTGGIRNYLILKKKDIPKSIDVTIPLPWPGHQDKIQNHFTFAVIEIPVGNPSHTLRLQNIFKQLSNLKSSAIPAYNYTMGFIAGMLPNPLMNSLLKGIGASILLSSLPGPPDQVTLFDLPCYPVFEGGYGKGDLGMGVSFTSMNGVIGISINPEEGIISTKADAETLLQCMINEFQSLYENSTV